MDTDNPCTSHNNNDLNYRHHVSVYLPDFNNQHAMLPLHYGDSCLV